MKVILALLLFAGSRFTASAQHFSEQDFKELQALAGIWKMESSRGVLYEEWQLQGNHQLNGRSFKLNNTDTIVLERTTLSFTNNTIIFSAAVSNQNKGQVVPFTLISNAGKRYIFENKDHDFPQRVIYHLVSAHVLQARIEGTKNSKEMGSDFNYSRVR